jgi:hypothetical protein
MDGRPAAGSFAHTVTPHREHGSVSALHAEHVANEDADAETAVADA